MINFPCPLCTNPVEAEAQPGTHHVDCPTCKGRIRVPPLARQLDDSPSLPESNSKRPVPLAAITGVAGGAAGLMFGLLVGVLVGRYVLAPTATEESQTTPDRSVVQVAVAPAASAKTAATPAVARPRDPPKGKTVTQDEFVKRITGMTLKDVNAFMGPPDSVQETVDQVGDHLRATFGGRLNIAPARPRVQVEYVGRIIDTKTGQRKSVSLFLGQGVVEDWVFNPW